jgi:hypothetical protein
MTLHTRVNQSRDDPGAYLCVIFEIRDRSGRVLHSENTRASDLMRWDMAWVSDDRVCLESSDIGTSCWRKQPDGFWVKEQAEKPPVDGRGSRSIPADPLHVPLNFGVGRRRIRGVKS